MTTQAFPEIQVKEDLREHVLARPDTYLGSFVTDKYKTFIVRDGKIVLDSVEYNPAFERTVIEVGSNAIDNVWRSRQFGVQCTSIRFEADMKTGVLSFWNDGLTIPVVKSKIPKLSDCWNPTIVFGVYMSSTNYNDNEKRRSSGRNGYGAKLTNTMSKWFQVETQDEHQGLFFSQTWKENMSSVDPATVSSRKGKGYTKVTWLPDYQRFKMAGLTDAVLGMFRKYLYDVAMLTKVPVYFNGELLPVHSVIDYARSFQENTTDEYLFIQTPDSEVVIYPVNTSKRALTVAFTNGIPNPDGGVHVDAWSRAVFSPLTSRLNPKDDEKKQPRLTMAEVKNHFAIFIVCSLDNPTFNSQEKVKLTSPKPVTKVLVKDIDKMMKWSVIIRINELLESKLLRAQKKKMEGTKKAFLTVKKLEDANLAGTTRSAECTLLYTEGDSAKSFAVTGLSKGIDDKSGRDFFGVLPCKGKILNVRKASVDKITDNEEIQALIQTLGLELGLDYTDDKNFARLRYGTFMIISDADDDGTHIEGLCQNFFHKLFPTLLKRNPPFILSMRTPIVRVMLKSGEEKKFYREQAFQEFQQHSAHLFASKPKRFKGLGTSNNRQVIESFGQRIVSYVDDERTDEDMIKAFSKKNSDIRKDWITSYNPDSFIVIEDEEAKRVVSTYSDFVNTELIGFSITSCERSLPNMIDGLKESQRKIIYGCMKNKLFHSKPSKKVYIMTADVVGLTEYKYGNDSLANTIVGMAWEFVGSNNIALLEPDGQFGTRLQFGKDASSIRYISSRLQEITPYIFREEDNPILDYIEGEDTTIEPKYYVPVVPMVLINGIRGGIGTGFSSTVPAFNPKDVLRCLRCWITSNLTNLDVGTKTSTGHDVVISELPEIIPWYQGFKGEMRREKDKKTKTVKYTSNGIATRTSDNVVEITELPIGMTTDSFREKLTSLRAEEKIVSIRDYCSTTRVHFIVEENPDKMLCNETTLKLSKSHNLTNMVGFNKDGKIHKYDCVDEIIYDFAQVRLETYEKRKKYTLADLEKKLVSLTAKRRFVEEVINGTIVVYRKKRAEIAKILEERKYPLTDGKYDYLLKMPIDSFTEDMIHKLDGILSSTQAEFTTITDTTVRQMWLKELDEFEQAYERYLIRWKAEEELVNGDKKPLKVQKALKKRR